MKTKKRLLPALLLSLFTALAAPASAQERQFSGVYVFGDSLSDAGFFRPFLLGLGLPGSVVAQLGRFTTNPGPVWSELVSEYYGFPAGPSNVAGGNIFAQGGARVSQPSASTPPGGAQRPVSTQIDEFLAANNGAADSNALYAVWVGGNDFLTNIAAFQGGAINQQQLQANVLGAASAEIAQIARLQAAGARYIAVFGLPDIGAAPASAAGGAAAVAAASALSAGYNTTLFTGLASAGIRVIPVDVFSLLNEIRANAAAFGFTNITGIACGPFPPITTSGNSQFCLPTNLVAPGAQDTFLFADAIHPTSATHRIIANLLEAMIDGPTQYSYLAEVALRTRASHVRSISDGLTAGRQKDVGGLGVFVSADHSKFDIDAGFGGLTGIESRNRSVTVGVTARASEAVMLGLAAGHGRNTGNFGADRGGFRVEENTVSLIGSVRLGGFYGTGVLSLAELHFNDVRRTFDLGPLRRTATSAAEGTNSSAQFVAGYDFALGRLNVGPTVSVTTQNVTVNGFDEAGGGSAGLRIHEQKRRSEVWSAGVRAAMTLGAWTPWLRVTGDKERRDELRHVSATPLTMLAIGSTYDIPAHRPDSSFTTAAVGINGQFGRSVAVSASYFRVSGRSGISEDGVSVLVAVQF